MYFLLSGEGLTDIGTDKGAATICEGNDFVVGPMAMIVSKIVECKHDYSIFDGACGFISERNVAKRAIERSALRMFKVFQTLAQQGSLLGAHDAYWRNVSILFVLNFLFACEQLHKWSPGFRK